MSKGIVRSRTFLRVSILTNSKKHTYTPRGSAKTLMESRDSEIVLSGPAGTGKSRSCLEKLHFQALKYPGMSGLIVRKAAVTLGSTALKTWRSFVVAEALAAGSVEFYGGSAQEPPQYKYDNGSRIFIAGMDKSVRIMSSEYDVIYVQECTELVIDDWEALSTRLRNGVLPYQQIIADCNPDRPTHWIKDRCDKGRSLMINCRHEDNPVLFNDDGSLTTRGDAYIKKLDELTGVRYLRLRKGLWVSSEGIIYDEFNPAVHVVDDFRIPDHWPRYWSIDFGFRHPFVCQNWTEDPDGRLYLYREIYMSGRTVDQHARDLLKIVQPDGPGTEWIEPTPQCVIADHDAEGRARFEKELGIGTRPANKKVIDGIQLVKIRLKEDRIFFFRGALVERDVELDKLGSTCSTLEEICGYSWLTTSKPGAKEQPVKEQDDGMDAMRYLIMERDRSFSPRVRWL